MNTSLIPTTQRPQRGVWREVAVALGVALVACALPLGVYLKSGEFYSVIFGLSALVLASYPMSRTSSLLPQIVARSIWWQSLLFGALMGGALGIDIIERLAFEGPGLGANRHLLPTSVMYVVGASTALLAAGKVGLNYTSSRFFPVEFRRSLMASLVMAIADTIGLFFYTGLELSERYGSLGSAATFAACGAVMSLAIWGLYRLKVWGLALNAVANVVIAGIAICGVFDLPKFLSFGLAATAVAQILLLVPLMRRVLSPARSSQ